MRIGGFRTAKPPCRRPHRAGPLPPTRAGRAAPRPAPSAHTTMQSAAVRNRHPCGVGRSEEDDEAVSGSTAAASRPEPQASNAYELFILVLTLLSLAIMVGMLLPLSEQTTSLLQAYDNVVC